VAAPSLRAAVVGAAAVVLLIRVGGFAARAHDEEFPAAFAHVGDEGLGLGGMANAWRTLPVLGGVAATLRRHARTARVVNLVAPLGLTTRLLLDDGLPAIGVCELPARTLRWLVRRGARESALRYGGLNHLGWFWPRGTTLRGAFRRALARPLVDVDVARRYGAIPLSYFYDVFAPASARRLGRASSAGRARYLARLGNALVQRYVATPGADVPEMRERPTPWYRDAVVPALATTLGGRPRPGFANVRNGGIMPELPEDAVIEVRARLRIDGASPEPPGPPPGRVVDFLRSVALADAFTYEAARLRDASRLAAAVKALPLDVPARRLSALIDCICAPVGS
jgi:6-phospho-beta-glucosidase